MGMFISRILRTLNSREGAPCNSMNISRLNAPKLNLLLCAALVLFCLPLNALGQNENSTLYGVLVDNSGSLRSQFDRVLELGNGVLAEALKHSPVSIFSFKEPSKKEQPLIVAHTIWNQDKTVLSNYLESLYIEPGQTNLMDAVDSMIKHINAKAESESKQGLRKVLVLITDGEDRKSKIKEKDLIAKLQQHQIRVYAIGLVLELDKEAGLMRPSAQRRSIKFLSNVTKETGGRALFPKSNSGDVQALLLELFAP